ncbi:chromatin assembly factor 1 subunit B [Acrasis kona]|uniref:Chromatin assembly factor 1 subunit B n=1 Tax=Acrasis kona TaxID=1008807 RepID=A0AAW2ZJF8_9EUKA
MRTIFFHDSYDKKQSSRPNAVLSVDMNNNRFATGSIANPIKIWEVRSTENATEVDFIAELDPVEDANRNVNIVRWSPDGNFLATGCASGAILVWRKSSDISPSQSEDEIQPKEQWTIHKRLNGHSLDVLDLAWSPPMYNLNASKQSNNKENMQPSSTAPVTSLLASASFDSKILIWDPLSKSEKKFIIEPIMEIKGDHKKAVQGVTWDPLGHFIATQSCDRTVRVYQINQELFTFFPPAPTSTPVKKGKKVKPTSELCSSVEVIRSCSIQEDEDKKVMLYKDEQAALFSRRLCFSTDGSILVTVTGQLPERLAPQCNQKEEQCLDTAYLFSRNQWKKPFCCLPGHNEPIVAVRFSPVLYQTQDGQGYGQVYCVLSKKSVVIYNTRITHPISIMKDCFSETISDATWSADGNHLIVSSWDGYCCIVTFDEGELGLKLSLNGDAKVIHKIMDQRAKGVQEMGVVEENVQKQPVTNVVAVRRRVHHHNNPPNAVVTVE